MTYSKMFNKANWFNQIKEPILWHYTSIDVLDSILRPGGSIKGTYYKNESDKDELLYGRSIWNEIMDKRKWFDRKEQYLWRCVNKCECLSTVRENTFLFCLTVLEDSLFHWDNYTPEKTGIAIGFQVSRLKDALTNLIISFPDEPPTFKVTEICRSPVPFQVHMDYCKYGNETDQEKDISVFIDNKVIPYLDQEDTILRILQQFYYCEAVVPFIKRERFSSEKEVRIYYSGPNLLKNSNLVGDKQMIDLFPATHMIDTIMLSPKNEDICYSKVCDIQKKYKTDFSIRFSCHGCNASF